MPKRKPFPDLAGQWVLIGRRGLTMPCDWFIARALWHDGEDVLTEHTPPSGMPSKARQVLHIGEVLAAGTYGGMADVRTRAVREVEVLHRRMREAEDALRDARAAVWAALDANRLVEAGDAG